MANDPLIGKQFGNYRVGRQLAQGGTARIYVGQDIKLQRNVALKIFEIHDEQALILVKRFVSEARIIARWRHDNILQVYYADQLDDLFYMAMELIEGMDLSMLLKFYKDRGTRMPVSHVMQIGHAIARALDFSHTQGIIHRDVKPSNVLISDDNRIVLADFGLALDIQQGSMSEFLGTPRYISPEQARNSSSVIPQSDIYSLGVILYEMLAGRAPFDDPSAASLVYSHIHLDPPSPHQFNPQLNDETVNVLLKALDKKPHERYQNGDELMEALGRALGSEIQDQTIPLDELSILERATNHLKPGNPVIEPPQPKAIGNSDTLSTVILSEESSLLPQPRKIPRILGAISLVSVVMIIGLLILSSNLNDTATPDNSSNPITTEIITQPASVTEVPASRVQSSSPPQRISTFNLEIAENSGGSLLITNHSDSALPLAALRLVGLNDQLTGDEWGQDLLHTGECVITWKGNAKKNIKSECTLVGDAITRPSNQRFWKDAFDVYLYETSVGNCKLEDDTLCVLVSEE